MKRRATSQRQVWFQIPHKLYLLGICQFSYISLNTSIQLYLNTAILKSEGEACSEWKQDVQSRKQVQTHGSWNIATLNSAKPWLRQEAVHDIPAAAGMGDEDRGKRTGPRASKSTERWQLPLLDCFWPRLYWKLLQLKGSLQIDTHFSNYL